MTNKALSFRGRAAEPGIHNHDFRPVRHRQRLWIPAFAGMTVLSFRRLILHTIPDLRSASSGMTITSQSGFTPETPLRPAPTIPHPLHEFRPGPSRRPDAR